MKKKQPVTTKDETSKKITPRESAPLRRRLLLASVLTVWTVIGFVLSQTILRLIIELLLQVNLLSAASEGAVFSSVATWSVYALTLLIVIGLPWKLYSFRTTKEDIGLTRLPGWTDILLAPASFIIYILVAGILMSVVIGLFPGFDAEEAQEIGFSNLSKYYEYFLAFFTLVIVAPVAEEVLVRGYLYGKLRNIMSVFGAVTVTAILFALLHLGIGSEQGGSAVTQINAALAILPLGIILALLRETTGNIWAGILLHMIKNGVAFYILFGNHTLFNALGG